jgi:hypothetical protein
MTNRRQLLFLFAATVVLAAALSPSVAADESPKKLKLLLIGQGPDGHPKATHEYMAGVRIVQKLLRDVAHLETVVEQADGDWLEGPQRIRGAHGVFLFVSEGAKWIQDSPQRLDAFAQLASRGGGLTVWHWGMGTKSPESIDGFLRLFGGCHGGPDRKYQVVETDLAVAREQPLAAGLLGFRIHDEFYYRLKFVRAERGVQPVLTMKIDGQDETVAWSWERPDGGRSFGFSGGHFHENWRRGEYRRLVAQAILWSLKQPIPEKDFPAALAETDFELSSSR